MMVDAEQCNIETTVADVLSHKQQFAIHETVMPALWPVYREPLAQKTKNGSTNTSTLFLSYSEIFDVEFNADEEALKSSTANSSVSSTSDNYQEFYFREPWLDKTLSRIASFRGLRDGWDGLSAKRPSRSSLDMAELIARAFLQMPVADRPIFSVDAEGCPSFAIYNEKLYLHLTIESDDSLTWYAEKDGTEYFEDEVVVVGSQAPDSLNFLLS